MNRPPALDASLFLVSPSELSAAEPGTEKPKNRETPSEARPNILIILADDFGWGDTSCNNPDAATRTPNIDHVASGRSR